MGRWISLVQYTEFHSRHFSLCLLRDDLSNIKNLARLGDYTRYSYKLKNTRLLSFRFELSCFYNQADQENQLTQKRFSEIFASPDIRNVTWDNLQITTSSGYQTSENVEESIQSSVVSISSSFRIQSCIDICWFSSQLNMISLTLQYSSY